MWILIEKPVMYPQVLDADVVDVEQQLVSRWSGAGAAVVLALET